MFLQKRFLKIVCPVRDINYGKSIFFNSFRFIWNLIVKINRRLKLFKFNILDIAFWIAYEFKLIRIQVINFRQRWAVQCQEFQSKSICLCLKTLFFVFLPSAVQKLMFWIVFLMTRREKRFQKTNKVKYLLRPERCERISIFSSQSKWNWVSEKLPNLVYLIRHKNFSSLMIQSIFQWM